MKVLIPIISILIICNSFGYAQKVIQMEEDGGVYKIPCLVNGVKMKFIFDTGASKVCISETMADYLFENDFLSKEDILGAGTSSVADGRMVDHISINLRDIEIEGLHLTNVKAVVISGQKAQLLLGQTAIQELGRISIDGDKLTIYNFQNNYTEDEIDKFLEQANKYIENNSYAAAIEYYLKVENNWGLSPFGLRKLAFCYHQNHQCNECLQVCTSWIEEYEFTSNVDEKTFIYNYMASCYSWLEHYDKAMLWYQKLIALKQNENLALEKYSLAECYYYLDRYPEAIAMYKNAINEECTNLGISISDIINNKVKEETLGIMFYAYGRCCNKLNEIANSDELLILSAKCGFKLAIKDCEENKLDYRQISGKLFD